jgi:hypothetical protein
VHAVLEEQVEHPPVHCDAEHPPVHAETQKCMFLFQTAMKETHIDSNVDVYEKKLTAVVELLKSILSRKIVIV